MKLVIVGASIVLFLLVIELVAGFALGPAPV